MRGGVDDVNEGCNDKEKDNDTRQYNAHSGINMTHAIKNHYKELFYNSRTKIKM